MSYQNRNSLVLLVIVGLICVCGFGLIQIRFGGKEFKKIEQELKEKENRVAVLKAALEEVEVYRKQLDDIKNKLNLYPKTILPEQTIPQTFRYLEEIDRYGTFFNFRFSLLGVNRGKDNITTASYEMSGEGVFPKIYRFIKRMEYGSPLYKIDEISLQRLSTKGSTPEVVVNNLLVSIKFSGIFYSKVEGSEYINKVLYAMIEEPSPEEYDPFKPLILEVLPPNVENLLVVENCKLVGITGREVYLQDPQGKIHRLGIGDRVYLGKLGSINLQDGIALFFMDRGGIKDTVKLSIKRK